MMLTIADVVEAMTAVRPTSPTAQISEAAVDSRQVKPGTLFVAVRGEHVDGHEFVAEAFSRGASCALVEREIPVAFPVLDLRDGSAPTPPSGLVGPVCLRVQNTVDALQKTARFWRSKLKVQVVGITGSVGKSTTKEVVSAVLSTRYKTLKSSGNFNNEIGLPLSVLQLRAEHQRAVLEMGFYVPGEIALLCGIAAPRFGVITNVGIQQRGRRVPRYDWGKAELVERSTGCVAILNYDDERGVRHEGSGEGEGLHYGLSPEADLWADQIEPGTRRRPLSIALPAEVVHAHVPMIGDIQCTPHCGRPRRTSGSTVLAEIFDGFRQGRALRLVAVRQVGSLILDDT
jgi:UDP-N-acetylmuramoyl-tripeptide--D-alanyl-D-alanine ligase